MIRRPPRSTLSSSSAASDVYKRQILSPINVGATIDTQTKYEAVVGNAIPNNRQVTITKNSTIKIFPAPIPIIAVATFPPNPVKAIHAIILPIVAQQLPITNKLLED